MAEQVHKDIDDLISCKHLIEEAIDTLLEKYLYCQPRLNDRYFDALDYNIV